MKGVLGAIKPATQNQVQAKNPLGVIPLDASKVEMKSEEPGDASRRYTFYICLGKQFIGYSKRDTYVVAAPSHQALAELTKVQEGITKLEGNVVGLESHANHEEGALMRAIVVWDILNQYLTAWKRGKRKAKI